MYQSFFGFKEKPFSLVPNPAYLFLSRSHEDALAHLSYAVSQGEGFMEITGEVGTGKTTLCRTFLENLNDKSEAAYIFNPKLNSVQLLKSICDELGIPSDANNTKDLIDELNHFLIAEKEAEKSVVILIDEAQNLEYNVLEQLRLLSNLETTRNKLLQIVLVGQPELDDMLHSKRLRQLRQRITLSCSLLPLSFKETRDYIQHRLNVASRKPGFKFPRPVVQRIYKFSKGIPRLINIASDRILLTAYGLNEQRITRKIATSAIKELTGNGSGADFFDFFKRWLLLPILYTALLLTILYPLDIFTLKLFSFTSPQQPLVGSDSPEKKHFKQKIIPNDTERNPIEEPIERVRLEPDFTETPVTAKKSVTDSLENSEAAKSAPVPEATVIPKSLNENTIDLRDWLLLADYKSTRTGALQATLKAWKVNPVINLSLNDLDEDERFFTLALKHNGFSMKKVSGDLNLIRTLNLPAIIKLKDPTLSASVFLTLIQLDNNTVTLITDDRRLIVANQNELYSYWTGSAYIPWKNFLACEGRIPNNASDESILTLKMILKEIGFGDIQLDPDYDETTQSAVMTLQSRNGLAPDGVVGPLTKIILYNEHPRFEIPHIRVN